MTYTVLVGNDLQLGLGGVDLVDEKGKEYTIEEVSKKPKSFIKTLRVKYAQVNREYLLRFQNLDLAKVVADQFGGVVARLDIDHLV